MKSDFPVMRLGDANRPALHSYFDICPESPDGSKVVFTQFRSDAVPGSAGVAIVDRNGGSKALIGDADYAIGHVGRFTLWLDSDRVAYRTTGTCRGGPQGESPLEDRRVAGEPVGGYTIHNLRGGGQVHREGNLRQWHTGLQQGLVQWPGNRRNPSGFLQGVRVVGKDGETLAELDVAEIAAALPPEAGMPEIESIDIRNLKWAPDGSRFFAVVTDELYRVRILGDVDARWRFKCIVLFSRDCSEIQYLGGFTHHPAWRPDGTGVTAMERTSDGRQRLVSYDLDCSRATLLDGVEGIHGSLDRHQEWFYIDTREPNRRYGHIIRHRLRDGRREDLVRFAHDRWDHTGGHHPHPVLSRAGDRVYFNAIDDGVCGLYALALV